MNPKQPPGPPMTLGNMRELGVARLIASCLVMSAFREADQIKSPPSLAGPKQSIRAGCNYFPLRNRLTSQ